MRTLLAIRLKHEREAVPVRQSARDVARLLGFEHHDQIRIATAVSELVRAALGDDDEVLVELLVAGASAPPQSLVVRVTGAQLAKEPSGQDGPNRGDGKISAQRLLDRFDEAADRPDTVALARMLPTHAPIVTEKRAREIRDAVEHTESAVTESYLTELKLQNRELSSTLYELERKQEELTRLNAELADTNRGVMALYAELDERANHLRRADEIKTKFLSNISHEFRTPLNSIRTLSHLLLDEADGPLSAEQLRQVQLIHGAAAEMLELVNDLLDLAKVEAGKSTLNVGRFTVGSLFGVLRGMMRPLLREPSVSLEFDEGHEIPPIVGDESKVAQVLRNFLSNAVKFTEEGRIRVDAEHLPNGARIRGSDEIVQVESVLFRVSDTGIGISPEDQEFIFDEFTQVRNALQPKVHGTGLGLPLCRKLSALLGGRCWVESELGAGSTFYLLIPPFFRPSEASAHEASVAPASARAGARKLPLLVVSEIDGHRRRLENAFDGTMLTPVCVGSNGVTSEYLSALRPEAAVVDVSSPHAAPPRLVETIAAAGIPTVRVADRPIPGDGCAALDGALVDVVYRQTARAVAGRVLLVDDDERFRSVLLKYARPHCTEAKAIGDPRAALETATAGGADSIVLDLIMPDLDGLTLLSMLRNNAATAGLPVLACSSKTPTARAWVADEISRSFSFEERAVSRVVPQGSRRSSGMVPRSGISVAWTDGANTMTTDGESLILIVDDKAAVRYVTERTIRNAGFRTAEAASGEEALAKIAALQPDLVLLDINMPDIDGYEVCRRLREDEATASIAVVMVSATFESAEHRVRGLEGGADTFLVAPVEPPVLVATVRAMLRLKRAEARLREFDRRKDEFLATLAHELRNPLAPLLYCIELLEPRVEGNELPSTVAIMRRQTEHLVRLVDDLVDVSRVTQNKLNLKLEQVTLQEVVDAAVEARRSEIEAMHQTLTVDMPAAPIELHGDRVRLAQVFGNLLSNSIKYTGAGGRIGISAQTEGSYAVVSVTDDGIGILREDLERIFGLFVQARHPSGGLGIGLALVHRIVQMHNGTIMAASGGLHRGSTFTVRLPVVPFGVPAERRGTDTRDSVRSEALKIVIVDDNVDSVDAMATLLRSMGHDVRACYDGPAALRAAQAFEPNLVFVDITMPGMNGYETVSALRAQPWSTRATICTLSGHGQAADRERSAAAGADVHLVKPIGRADLERVIEQARVRALPGPEAAPLEP